MFGLELSPFSKGVLGGAWVLAVYRLLQMYAKVAAQEPVPFVPFKLPYVGDDGGDE